MTRFDWERGVRSHSRLWFLCVAGLRLFCVCIVVSVSNSLRLGGNAQGVRADWFAPCGSGR